MGPATYDPDFGETIVLPGTNTPIGPPVTPPANTPQQQFNWMQLISGLGSTFSTLAPYIFGPQTQGQTGGQFQTQPPVQPRPTFDPTLLLLIGLGVFLIVQKK